jgi:beta-xylosidase
MTNRFDRLDTVLGEPKPKAPRKISVKPLSEDERSIHDRIRDGVYNTENYIKWPGHKPKDPEVMAEKKEYYAIQGQLTEVFQQDVYVHCGVQNNPKRDACWSKAWEHGHSAGLHEVLTYFEDFVDLILPTAEERDQVVLTQGEEYAVFAGFCAMFDDVHSVQDQMSDAQWKEAEALYRRLETRVNAREAAKKPPPPRRPARKRIA